MRFIFFPQSVGGWYWNCPCYKCGKTHGWTPYVPNIRFMRSFYFTLTWCKLSLCPTLWFLTWKFLISTCSTRLRWKLSAATEVVYITPMYQTPVLMAETWRWWIYCPPFTVLLQYSGSSEKRTRVRGWPRRCFWESHDLGILTQGRSTSRGWRATIISTNWVTALI